MTVHGDSVRFAVLGTLRGWRGATELDLGSPQQRALLALLLLSPDASVSTHTLMDALWGEELPARAAGTLRTYVSRLRKVLEAGRTDPTGRTDHTDRTDDTDHTGRTEHDQRPGHTGRSARPAARTLVSVRNGYALRLPHDAVDLRQFEDRVTTAARIRTAGRAAEARDMLRTGLALWTGDPLSGLTGPGILAHRALLADRRLAALEARLDLDLELGDHAAVIGELSHLAARHPLRERLCVLLMRALHRSGRTADALTAHESTRLALAAELGLSPGPELTAVGREIARQYREPAVASPSPAQLPGDIADFTGREDSMVWLRARLERPANGAAPVVAISGMPGVGKSTLAVHAAHQLRGHYPQGQLYAALRAPDGRPVAAAAALAAFLRAFGVADRELPAGLTDLATHFRSRIADRRMLIVLDNAHDACQIRPFLPGTGLCAVLVTSVTDMAGLSAARILRLDVMTPDEAVALLRRVIGAARTDAEPEATARLSELCGRLPLALRIVAARLVTRPSWTLASFAGRLADTGWWQREPRVADLAVESCFRREFDGLDEERRRTLRLLSAADSSLVPAAVAADALGRSRDETEALCESLVDACLLESSAPGRYGFHPLLRAYARHRATTEEAPSLYAEVRRRLAAAE